MPIKGPQIRITADTDPAKVAVDKLAKHIDRSLDKATKKIDSHVNRAVKNMTREFNRAAKSITTAFRTVSGVFTVLFGHRMIQQIFNTINVFQGLKNVFSTFASDAQEATQQMEFLRKESQRLGFEISTIGTAYQKMFAAGRITGFSADKLQEIFTSVSEAAVVANMDSRQLEGALRALHQMMSKGKVQAEELRGQLGEHLPGAFEIAARAMGVTTKELDKMLSTGDVTAVTLFEKFPEELRKAYGAGLATALGLPRREMERLKNDISLTIEKLDDGFNAFFGSLISITRKALGVVLNLFDESFSESLETASYYIRAIPDILNAAVKFMAEYLRPLVPAFQSTFETITVIIGAVFKWIKDEFSTLFDFIGFTLKHLPALFAQAGRNIGIYFGYTVTTIKDLWNDGITFIAAKFDSWIISLRVGLLSIRVWFSDMMVNIVRIVDSGFQGLAGKIMGMADLASNVLPDSWSEGIRSAGMSIRKSSAGLVAEMTSGNDKLYGKLSDLKRTQVEVGQIASNALKNLVDNQARNYKQFQDASIASSNQLKSDIINTNNALDTMSLTIRNAVSYYEDLNEAAKMGRENIDRSANSAQNVAQALEQTSEKADKAKEKTKKIKEEIDKIADAITNNLNSAFDDFLETGRINFKSLLHDITADIAKVEFNRLIAEPLGKYASKGMDSFFSAAFNMFFAKGGVFNQGRVIPFARGGIVNSPTVFPMAKGAGLMGEAGPEAVMPLSKNEKGELGVKNVEVQDQKKPVEEKRPFNIINVMDPTMVKDYLNTPDGQDTLLNFLQHNSTAVRQVLA